VVDSGNSRTNEKGNQHAVLLIEPDEAEADLIGKYIKEAGFGVEVARTFEEGIFKASHNSFSVVISEYSLGDSSRRAGDLISSIREMAHASRVPFLGITEVGEDAQMRALKDGFDATVEKPARKEMLQVQVAALAKRYRTVESSLADSKQFFRQQILRTISHEFRTPLVGITIGCELLGEGKGSLADPKIKSMINTIQASGERLRSLVSDFLLCQQIEAGIARRAFENHCKKHRIQEVVDRYLAEHQESMSSKGFTIECIRGADDVFVNAYDRQIHEVLHRLTSNACKFSPERKEISVMTVAADGMVTVAIADRGIGINPEEVGGAFEPFVQHNREVWEQQGSGLGLTVARGLAELNGAHLSLRPRDGGGTIAELSFGIEGYAHGGQALT
jgi:two-component system sensor histidine kinase/response regulator